MRFINIVILILVVSILFSTACSQVDEVNEGPNGLEENIDGKDLSDNSNELISEQDPKDKPNESEEAGPAAEEPNNENIETKTDSGRYVGLADSMHIEVLISGVPEEKAAKTFVISEKNKIKIKENQIGEGDQIKFEYYVNENKAEVIVELTKIEN
jgi:hypothetical protein